MHRGLCATNTKAEQRVTAQSPVCCWQQLTMGRCTAFPGCTSKLPPPNLATQLYGFKPLVRSHWLGWPQESIHPRAGLWLQSCVLDSTVLMASKLCARHSPLSLLSSTRMTSFRSWEGVWLTTLCTERRMTESASLTKMKTTEIWGRSSEYVICLHLWEAWCSPGVHWEAGTAVVTVGGQPGRF